MKFIKEVVNMGDVVGCTTRFMYDNFNLEDVETLYVLYWRQMRVIADLRGNLRELFGDEIFK